MHKVVSRISPDASMARAVNVVVLVQQKNAISTPLHLTNRSAGYLRMAPFCE